MGGASKLLMLLSTPFPLMYPRPSALRLASLSAAPGLARGRRFLSSSAAAAAHRRPEFAVRAAAEPGHAHGVVGEGYAEAPPPPPPPPPPFPVSRVVARPWPEWTRLVEHLAAGGYADRLGAASSVAIGGSVGGGDDDDSFVDREGLTEEFIKTAGTCLSFARDRPELLRMLSKKDFEVIVENGSPFLFRNGDNSIRRMQSFLDGSESNVLESERAKTVDIIRYLLSYVFNPDGTVDTSNSKAKELTEASVRNLFAELVSVSGNVWATGILESIRQPPLQQHEQLSRPPGQNIEMKRGDWICTKCSFMNFARNMRCLECNEVRPKRVLTGGEWECPQCDFFNYGRNMSCLRCDCKRPGELPVNPLAAPSGSTGFNRTSSVEQILNGSNVQFRNNPGFGGPSSGAHLGRASGTGSDKSSISKTLDRILGRSSASSGSSNENVNSSENRENLVNQRRDPNHVPFVPLPPDMFAKTQNTNPNPQSAESTIANRGEKEDSDAAERWSKKVAELDNTADLSSAISDEDFPEIMPMRKGENRFVISKKKDRSLTSPQYKRRIALEQANNSNFVPFVPFPPDYFAKKDKPSETNASPTVGPTEGSRPPETNGTNFSQNNLNENNVGSAYGAANDSSQEPNTPGYSRSSSSWNSGYSTNSTVSSGSGSVNTQQPESASSSKASWNRGFPGKSLEGSAVKDPDPLDMSEEAKAERWFRRAAQIKDISELANIPDEDFPEIMPMRKGVNRFVVSKRKTPLERRLTSPQYRRNLPIVSSEPEKDSN